MRFHDVQNLTALKTFIQKGNDSVCGFEYMCSLLEDFQTQQYQMYTSFQFQVARSGYGGHPRGLRA